jgi:hypothetical protein
VFAIFRATACEKKKADVADVNVCHFLVRKHDGSTRKRDGSAVQLAQQFILAPRSAACFSARVTKRTVTG